MADFDAHEHLQRYLDYCNEFSDLAKALQGQDQWSLKSSDNDFVKAARREHGAVAYALDVWAEAEPMRLISVREISLRWQSRNSDFSCLDGAVPLTNDLVAAANLDREYLKKMKWLREFTLVYQSDEQETPGGVHHAAGWRELAAAILHCYRLLSMQVEIRAVGGLNAEVALERYHENLRALARQFAALQLEKPRDAEFWEEYGYEEGDLKEGMELVVKTHRDILSGLRAKGANVDKEDEELANLLIDASRE